MVNPRERDRGGDRAQRDLPWRNERFARAFLLHEEPPAGWSEVEAAALALRLDEGARVLDLGCGGGRSLFALARLRPDLRLLGVDASEAVLAVAREREALQGGDPLPWWTAADMTELPVADGAVQLVLSTFGSFLVLDDAGARHCLGEAFRCLRPGGELVLEFPAAAALEELDGLRDWEEHARSSWAWEGPHLLLTTNEIVHGGRSHRRVDRVLPGDGQGGFRELLPEEGGSAGRTRYVQTSRIWSAEELSNLAEELGFAVESPWEDWDGSPFQATSARLIFRAHRP